jgi:uncharacterized membrane protein YphA (DoxX/SURF4 family)
MKHARKLLDHFIRITTGGLFIFSGLIKLNDPIGTEIKLEEYFEVFANDFAGFFHWFVPAALEIGMLIIVLEVVLGIAVLVNFRMELTTKILLGLIVFFTFLTFYSAYFNKVTDCGCFGDAIPLTPWESFIKDLILLTFIVHLFWYRKDYVPLLPSKAGLSVIIGTTVISFIVGIYAIMHLPYIDFRPYGVGDNIPYNMIPEEQPIFEYVFEKDGEEINSTIYLMEDDGYTYLRSGVINEDKTIPKITDYNVWHPETGDYTEQSLVGKKLFLIVVDVKKANLERMDDISRLIQGLDDDVEAIMLTSSDPSVTEPFRHEYQLAVPYYFSDATVLKAMIRSIPGIMILENGTVKGKWHYNDVPTAEEVNRIF